MKKYTGSILAIVVLSVCFWWGEVRSLYLRASCGSPEQNFLLKSKVNIEASNLRGGDVVANRDSDTSETKTKNASEEKNDAPLFVLHIGPPKTGTTTLQMFAAENEELLERDNVYYLGQARKGGKDFRSFFGLCCNNKVAPAGCDEKWKEFEKIVNYHYSKNHNVFLSHEMIIRATNAAAENKNLWEYLVPLLKKWRVRIVYTYRRQTEWIPSKYHQEFNPNGPINTQKKRQSWPDKGGQEIPPFATYVDDHIRLEKTDPTEKFQSLVNVKKRWESHFQDVEVFNTHQAGDMVENFYCQVLPEASTVCKQLQSKDAVAEVKNPSSNKPLHFYMLADGAYRNGWVGKEKAKPEIAQAIEKHSQKLGLAEMTDFPLECLTQEQEEALLEYSLEFESEILPDFYALPEGEQGLRSSFAEALEKKTFCSVDVEETLKDERWGSFFRDLNDRPGTGIDVSAVQVSKNESKKNEKTSGKEAPLFILHVGPPKTGTTALQMFAASNEEQLMKDNIYFLGQVRNDKERDLRDFFGLCCGSEVAPSGCDDKWKEFGKVVEKHFSQDHNVFFSQEMIIGAKNEEVEKENLWKYLEPLLSKWRVRVVFSYRRQTEWIPSTYHQAYNPNGPIKTQEKRQSWPDAGGIVIPSFPAYLDNHLIALKTDRVEKFRSLSNVKKRWDSRFDNVEIFNYHEEGDMLENFFCEMIPEARSLCKQLQEKDSAAEIKNPSTDKPLHFHMLADEAYQNGLVDKKRTKPEIARAIEQQSKRLGLEELSDFPLSCLSESEAKSLLDYSLAYEMEIAPEFYSSSRGEQGLRSSFAEALETETFCSVDVKKTLKDERWKAFFRDLKAGVIGEAHNTG